MINLQQELINNDEIKMKEIIQNNVSNLKKNFIELKQQYNEINKNSKQVECFLPVHLTIN